MSMAVALHQTLLLLLLVSIAISSSCIHRAVAQTTTSTYVGLDGKRFVTYSFPSFANSLLHLPANLTVLNNASISQGALQITPDSSNSADGYLVNQTGRVFFSSPFTLWSPPPAAGGTYVASFSMVFRVNIFRTNTSVPGEGVAFVVASGLDPPPPGSYGGFLGLTNASTDGDDANRFVALELDTVKQAYDPDDNHVGLDVNGVRSVKAVPLAPFGIKLGAANASNFFVWVDYNGTSRYVWMYMARSDDGVPSPKPPSPVLDAPLDLSRVVAEKAYFGFSASTGTRFQLNCLHMWNMTVELLDDGSSSGGGHRRWKLGLSVGVPCGVAALPAGALMAFLYIRKRRRRVGDDPESLSSSAFKFNKSSINLRSLAGTPKEFEYTELRKGTEDFAAKNKLGQGGYGVVYKATVAGDSDGESVEVAVKQFSAANTKGQEDFLAELSIINRLRHRNLVRLRGWCHQNGVLLLVYDYMPNGSLDKHLFGGAAAPVLSWEQRYNIVAGVAAALNYLHHEYDQRVIHRDIKPSNIMLDSAFGARLGDFGLARALDSDKTSYTEIMGVPGTMGYIAPECFHTGRATRESDVFGLGAVLLEVACGRRISSGAGAGGDGAIGGCSRLLEWVWRLHGAGRILDAVDPKLASIAFDADDAERLLLLGLACSHPDPGARPTAKAVVQVLARAVDAPAVPPSKPAFMWPALSGADCDDDDGGGGMSARTTSTELTSSTYYASSSYSSHGCTRTQVTSSLDAIADETRYMSVG
uniref:Protein kinase domain-containing protein n=1 Tax=Oryza punctata TaxID=4537 RepID=A0A0E0LB58_ORYPU